MKVTHVEIFDIECPKRPGWNPVFIRVHTDEGITGVGEAGLAYDWGHSAAAAMLKEISEAILIGFNPFNTELLWSRMLRESFWGLGGGPVLYSAMSAMPANCSLIGMIKSINLSSLHNMRKPR